MVHLDQIFSVVRAMTACGGGGIPSLRYMPLVWVGSYGMNLYWVALVAMTVEVWPVNLLTRFEYILS